MLAPPTGTAVPRPTPMWRRHSTVAAVLTALLASLLLFVPMHSAHAADTLLSQGKTATASSTENGGTPASAAVDGNTGTRWSSAAADPQWLQVDLGATATISSVTLNWETAYAKAFKIQTSADGTNWTDVYSTTTATGGTQTVSVNGSGRYVRMYGTVRATQYGYSLWEFQVYGSTGGGTTTPPTGGTLLSQGKTATASSTENGGTPASAAVDGNTGTRWSSAAADPQWLQVDLGATATISSVVLNWETAYGKAFTIQTSNDGTSWTDIYSTTTGTGGTQTLAVNGSGRYVRLYGTVRATGYGYSLWEFQVFGTAGTTGGGDGGSTGGGGTGPIQGGGDLGPNVKVFDPSTPNIQGQLDSIFAQQEKNQFGDARYQVFFKPGTYNGLNDQIGFYTSVSGLGKNPDDVQINGDMTVDAGWFNGNATQNFWRSVENMAIKPVSGTDRWAVAQAAPFRRIHVEGGLNLAPNGYGWASGGYIADSKVDGTVGPYSQQQWYTRDSSIGGWTNSVWNMVFSGVQGAPAQNFSADTKYTTLATTPESREKPYMYLDGSGNYQVFVPSLRTNASGVSWPNTPGTSVPLTQFYVAKPGVSAATINAALAQGLNLLFTPGIYHVDQPINVTRANTVVLGLGYATVIPDNGVDAMKVADVDGVRLAGFLIDAGAGASPQLLQVGTPGSTASHASNPTTVQDVFARVGGAAAAQAQTAFEINSNDVIIDHTWIWRADHGAAPTGWTVNPADIGLKVNGNNVLATGLFVEHFKKYDVEWSGQNGRTIFFQNEKAYDAPNQAAVQNGSTRGFAAYKVDDNVTSHEGWGLGSYCNYTADPTIIQDHGFEAPTTAGVKFHDLLVVSLGGMGQYAHVINNTGPGTSGTSTVPSIVTSYP